MSPGTQAWIWRAQNCDKVNSQDDRTGGHHTHLRSSLEARIKIPGADTQPSQEQEFLVLCSPTVQDIRESFVQRQNQRVLRTPVHLSLWKDSRKRLPHQLGAEPQIYLEPCNLGIPHLSQPLPGSLAFFLSTSESIRPLTRRLSSLFHLSLSSSPCELICEYCVPNYPLRCP